ncbi:XK-related protein 8-like [Gouania willdenowi]|uniref:XK-related protein n=1 Tax=Gouania willdenowi TaxID=441366 RepID=A0A8C5HN24_GOUWI|nr:XK-related protein 8-like [Gouania willdenowi]
MVFRYSRLDLFFTCLGLFLFLLDLVLDMKVAVGFYQEGSFWCLGILLLFLGGSSVLVQLYSWLFYSYDPPPTNRRSEVEQRVSPWLLKLLHVLQMGIYLRNAGVLVTSIKGCWNRNEDLKDLAVYLSYDLSILRIVETFSESAPQLVLMLTVILQQGVPDIMTVMKALVSAAAIAFSMTTYHRSLRSFLQNKNQQTPWSSLVYFSWNVLLVSARLAALTLFSSVLPCFIFTHFLCSWMMFFFFAWRLQTSFMDSASGEWLYRATVGLIWYFNWFNVVDGRTIYKSLAYHGFILVDISVLCGVWYWRMSSEPPHYVIPHLHIVITAASVVGFYIMGLLLKLVYYRWFHPTLSSDQLKGAVTEVVPDEVDSRAFSTEERSAPCNKRMRQLAQNFYT